jgi:hypothetical protein
MTILKRGMGEKLIGKLCNNELLFHSKLKSDIEIGIAERYKNKIT